MDNTNLHALASHTISVLFNKMSLCEAIATKLIVFQHTPGKIRVTISGDDSKKPLTYYNFTEILDYGDKESFSDEAVKCFPMMERIKQTEQYTEFKITPMV